MEEELERMRRALLDAALIFGDAGAPEFVYDWFAAAARAEAGYRPLWTVELHNWCRAAKRAAGDEAAVESAARQLEGVI